MITNFIQTLHNFLLPLDFFCHLVIFIGGFYIAIHSRVIPRWLVTCIWYMGAASLLTSTSIILQWVYGEEFPLSYMNIGVLSEVILNINLAIAFTLLFTNTVAADIKGSKKRNNSTGAP